MTGIGNDNQIVYIQVNEEKICEYITHLEEKKGLFGNIIRKEGFYYTYLGINPIKLNDMPMYFTAINNKVIRKPHIIIEYSNGKDKTINFNTDKDMHLFLIREFQGRNWREFD